MRVVAKRILREFWETHPDCERSLRSWWQAARSADWRNPSQVKAAYPSASILRDDRVVFNIHGNKYRLVVKVRYDYEIVYVRFLGSHTEYDAIDAGTI